MISWRRRNQPLKNVHSFSHLSLFLNFCSFNSFEMLFYFRFYNSCNNAETNLNLLLQKIMSLPNEKCLPIDSPLDKQLCNLISSRDLPKGDNHLFMLSILIEVIFNFMECLLQTSLITFLYYLFNFFSKLVSYLTVVLYIHI